MNDLEVHSRSSVIYYFLLVVSNSILHRFRDIRNSTVHVTACDFDKYLISNKVFLVIIIISAVYILNVAFK